MIMSAVDLLMENPAALEQPGVIAAFTGRDLAPDYGSLPTAWVVSEDLIVPDHPPIAADEARYLGDAVAVVVAEDPYQAADAAEAVQVEYEPLPRSSTRWPRSPTVPRWCTPARPPTAPSPGRSAAATTRPRGAAPRWSCRAG